MGNSIYSRTNILLSALFAILAGIITIIDPSYTKWGTDETANTMTGIVIVIGGSIVGIVQGISIYRSSKKDKKENK